FECGNVALSAYEARRMPRRLLLAFSLLVSFVTSAADPPAEQALSSVIAEYERILKQVDPISAGQEGDRDALRRWPDVRPGAARENRMRLKALAGELAKIDTRELAAGSSLSYALLDRKSTRLNSSHVKISYAVFCLTKRSVESSRAV